MGRRNRKKRGAQTFPGGAALLFVFILALLLMLQLRRELRNSRVYSDSVEKWRPSVERCAKQEHIPLYTDCLLAIMQVESNGETDDVMQSSESLGLEPNALDSEASIAQGCAYFAMLVRSAESNYLDLQSTIQAYNFGKGYLYYVASNGGRHSRELAEQFAAEQSGGVKKQYRNPVALEANGGWRYAYGNMFYAELVNELLDMRRKEMELSIVSTLLVLLAAGESAVLAALELILPHSALSAQLLRLGERELKRHSVQKLVRNRGLQHGMAALLLLYGCFASSNPREFCAAVLVALLASAFYGALSLDPLMLFWQGGPAAVALTSILLTSGLPY